MSLADDHGGYWANDEGFILPVIRHIDDPRGSGENSRFYRARIDRTLRIERRRRRVALLLAWRWTAFAAAVISLLALLAPGAPDAAATGNEVAAVWSLVPGGDFVSGIIDGVGNVVAVVLNSIGFTGFTAWLGSIGPTILGALVPILGVLAIFMAGNTSWTHHDALERRAIRAECLQPSGYGSARSEATLVVGGLIAVMLASWTASAPAVLACLAVTALLALVVRRTGPRRDNAANIARVDAIRQAR
jgi:hypothetical protein